LHSSFCIHHSSLSGIRPPARKRKPDKNRRGQPEAKHQTPEASQPQTVK
jgi:hypothetical protein